MNIGITGGCGFIGINLIKYLLESSNYNIYILDLKSLPSFIFNDQKSANRITTIHGNICDSAASSFFVEASDIIIHLAANTGIDKSIISPVHDLTSNVLGTLNLLELSRFSNIKKFVYASSNAAVGNVPLPISEGCTPNPISPYGISKLAGEYYCRMYYSLYKLKTIVLRFSNVYGPYSDNKNSVITRFIKNAISKNPLTIYGDGKQTRDFIYVSDVIQAIMISIDSSIEGEVFQVGTGKQTSIIDICNVIQSRVGDIERIYKEPRIGDINNNYSNVSKIKKMLGFTACYNINSGINKCYSYFENNQGVEK